MSSDLPCQGCQTPRATYWLSFLLNDSDSLKSSAYAPKFQLWSDSATKKRWIYLPPGSQIDTSDMDFWKFPVGTKVWKEFSAVGREGYKAGRLRFLRGLDPARLFFTEPYQPRAAVAKANIAWEIRALTEKPELVLVAV